MALSPVVSVVSVAPASPRRRALALLAALSPLLGSRPAQAQPGNPGVITLYVPWPAGGATDVTLRMLADLAGQQLGQKIIIENRPGAGGSLAMPLLQQAPADGSVLAQMPQPVFRIPFLQKVAWDPIRDTTPILQISGVTFGILVASNSPLRHLGDLLDFARQHPGELSVATNGNGTTPHVVMEELLSEQGLRYIHVPYKGTAEQMLAVAAGQVMVGVNSNGFAPYVDSGRLRLLVTFSEARTRRWPQVPTLKELGYPIVATSPYGLVGPRGMAPELVQRLHASFKAALFHPRHLAELAKYDQEPAYLGPADYGRSMAQAYALERRQAERQGLIAPNA
ncbi:tripartite tricarboxylate transporter substrate binding protein [Curvibacter gracilis]|uniref:tripartite tricarboxylate transporter substrate binding protein n=1 Tax=Curvibacter gracilis TaxID=230310 RepID=UPI0004821AD8|nr:tripartite tricarboxylate transporter substrate binding protein [Curvibacter gracilis]